MAKNPLFDENSAEGILNKEESKIPLQNLPDWYRESDMTKKELKKLRKSKK